jgi:hypothetical protein
MKKPGAVIHMTGYGLVYGLLLAMLYIWGFLIVTNLSEGLNFGWNEIWGAVGFTAYFAFVFGALPGGAMGFIEGWILKFLTRDIQPPLEQDTYTGTRNLSFGIIGGLTFLGMASLLSVMFGAEDSLFSLVFIVLPAVVAGGASMYAVNRYMLKLRAWGSIGKAKHDHKIKNQLTYMDVADDDTSMVSESHSQSQRPHD